MKQLLMFLFASCQLTVIRAQEPANSYLLSAHTITINGTSNLHNWKETVEEATGKGTVQWNADKSFMLQAFTITMQVRSIKSGEGAVMNNKTYKALKADRFPEIIFVLSEPILVAALQPGVYTVAAKGMLTIAGNTRPVIVPIRISGDAQKKCFIEGSLPVKMSEYGIDAPTALLGTLKTGDQLTIAFNTTFSPVSN